MMLRVGSYKLKPTSWILQIQAFKRYTHLPLQGRFLSAHLQVTTYLKRL